MEFGRLLYDMIGICKLFYFYLGIVDELKGFNYRRTALIGAVGVNFVLTGCSLVGGDSGKSEEPSAPKVMYYDERSFYSQLGMLYSALHPEVDITVVTNQNQNASAHPRRT